MTIRTILVDDEPLAIQGLQLRLEKHDDVEIVETCSNGREAIRAIKTNKPDLVFLDIQMPGFDGFSVIQGLMEVEPPLVRLRHRLYRPRHPRLRGAGGRLSDEAGRGGPARRHARPGAPAAQPRRAASRRPRSSRKCSPRWRRTRSTRSSGSRGRPRLQPLREADQHQGPRPDLPGRRRFDREDRRGRRLHVHLHGRQHADPARDDEGPREAPRPAPLPARPQRAASSISTRSGRSSRTPTANASWCWRAEAR